MNLLHNATKYTPGREATSGFEAVRDGELDRGPRDATTAPRDPGRHAPDRIFEMFTQVESLARTQTVRADSGSVSASTRQLVAMHGGTPPGQEPRSRAAAARFVVRLPILVGWTPEGGRVQEKGSRRSRIEAEFRILVVDDSVDSAATLRLPCCALTRVTK